MDFTREPIIESVITPREGCTLVVRSSKGSGQEEYFVDALEIIIFGNAIFFRSRERPKAFMVPATDYEVLEVRETRLVLKNVGLDRSIKIGGGREAPLRMSKDTTKTDKPEKVEPAAEKVTQVTLEQTGLPVTTEVAAATTGTVETKTEARIDKKRDRRRNYRRRRGKDDEVKAENEGVNAEGEGPVIELPPPQLTEEEITAAQASVPVAAVLSSLLAPPPNLISETIARYKDNALFKGAFFTKDDEAEDSDVSLPLEVSDFEGDVHANEEVHSSSDLSPLSTVSIESEEIELPNLTLDYPIYQPPKHHVLDERIESDLSRELRADFDSKEKSDTPFQEAKSEDLFSIEQEEYEPVSEPEAVELAKEELKTDGDTPPTAVEEVFSDEGTFEAGVISEVESEEENVASEVADKDETTEAEKLVEALIPGGPAVDGTALEEGEESTGALVNDEGDITSKQSDSE